VSSRRVLPVRPRRWGSVAARTLRAVAGVAFRSYESQVPVVSTRVRALSVGSAQSRAVVILCCSTPARRRRGSNGATREVESTRYLPTSMFYAAQRHYASPSMEIRHARTIPREFRALCAGEKQQRSRSEALQPRRDKENRRGRQRRCRGSRQATRQPAPADMEGCRGRPHECEQMLSARRLFRRNRYEVRGTSAVAAQMFVGRYGSGRCGSKRVVGEWCTPCDG